MIETLPDRAAWLEARAAGECPIGSSDAARIATGAFGGAWGFVGERLGLVAPRETLRMRAGLVLEPLIVEELQRRGFDVSAAPPFIIHRDPDEPWMLATVDAWLGDDVLELKTVEWHTEEWGPDGAPAVGSDEQKGAALYAYAQCLWQMHVTRRPMGHVGALLMYGDWEVRLYPCEPAPATLAVIRRAVERIRARVLAYELPEPDDTAECTEVLRAVYDENDGEIVKLGPGAEEIAARYDEARARAKAAEKEKAEAGNRLRLLLGEHKGAIGARFKVARTASNSLDVRKVA